MNHSNAEGVRPRRFATACDVCFRRKVKCVIDSSSCANCVRRGIQCTFTRAEPDLRKPRRAARQLKVVNERLRHVEDLLESARSQSHFGIADGDIQALLATSHLGTSSPSTEVVFSSVDILQPPVQEEVLIKIEQYFEYYDRFYLRFEKMNFINMIVQPSSRPEGQLVVLRACVHAMMSIAWRMANFSLSQDRNLAYNQADEHLRASLTELGIILSAKPTILSIQTLICICTSMMLSSLHSFEESAIMLSAAIRSAQILRLDIRIHDIPPKAQSVRYCLVESLYILDKELSLQAELPSQLPSDEMGTREGDVDESELKSVDGVVSVNMLEARIALARLQDRVLSILISKNHSSEARLAIADDIRATLTDWNAKYLPSSDHFNAASWPEVGYVHLVRLLLSYFLVLRRIFPENSDSREIEHRLDQTGGTDRDKIRSIRADSLPVELISASRLVFASVRSIGKAGLPWLREVLPSIIAATAIMLQAVVVTTDMLIAQADLDRADTWYSLLNYLMEEDVEYELSRDMEVLTKLRSLAKMATEIFDG